MLDDDDDEPSLFLIFYFPSRRCSLHLYVCLVPRFAINRRPDADPYNIRKSVDLGGNTDNVRIIYNSVRSLLVDVSLSVDLIVIQKCLGKVCVGFDPQERSEDSFTILILQFTGRMLLLLIPPILVLTRKLQIISRRRKSLQSLCYY